MILKKLLEGFVFGVGFALAVALAVALVARELLPSPFRAVEVLYPSDKTGLPVSQRPREAEFNELPLEEQIKQASVIALVRYESSPDGKMKAVIREFLKQDPSAIIHYKVGDEFTPGGYYPTPSRDYGDGAIIFFVGAPASMRRSLSYFGDRIHGLGDMPLALFRKKCAVPKA